MNRYLFNIGTLNICTDASVKNLGNKYISCAGCICVITKENGSTEVIEEKYFVLDDASNNRGELYAICQAILLAIKYRNNFNTINILSDSQFSIFGLREWVYKWRKNIVNDTYVNVSGKSVANQDLFKFAIHTILSSNIHINFYHQKGHSYTTKGMKKARNVFRNSNGFDLPDVELEAICYYNDLVDINTGYKLSENAYKIPMPLIYTSNFDEKQYRKLVNKVK